MRAALICKSTWPGSLSGLKYIIIISILNTWKWGWQKGFGTDSMISQIQRSSLWACLREDFCFSRLTHCKWLLPLAGAGVYVCAAANYSDWWSCLQTTVVVLANFKSILAQLDLFWKPSVCPNYEWPGSFISWMWILDSKHSLRVRILPPENSRVIFTFPFFFRKPSLHNSSHTARPMFMHSTHLNSPIN